jgi:transposase
MLHIQFRAYPNNNACLHKIFQLRFANLVCPECENDKPFAMVKDRRSYQCPSCDFQVYPTEGTIFEKNKHTIDLLISGHFLINHNPYGVAGKELERQLNVCYKTALRMNHQINYLWLGIKIKVRLPV